MLPEESFCQAVEVISENTKGNLEYCAHKSFYLLDLNENFLLFLNLKKKQNLTGYLPGIHKPAHEGGVGEENSKHMFCTDVENPVQILSTRHLRQTNAVLH